MPGYVTDPYYLYNSFDLAAVSGDAGDRFVSGRETDAREGDGGAVDADYTTVVANQLAEYRTPQLTRLVGYRNG